MYADALPGPVSIRKPSAVLPELNSHPAFLTDDPNSSITNSQSTCLPILSKEGPARAQRRSFGDECKLLFNILTVSLCDFVHSAL